MKPADAENLVILIHSESGFAIEFRPAGLDASSNGGCDPRSAFTWQGTGEMPIVLTLIGMAMR